MKISALFLSVALLSSVSAFADQPDQIKTIYKCQGPAAMDTFTTVTVKTGGIAGLTTAEVAQGFLGRMNKQTFIIEGERTAPGSFPVPGLVSYVDSQTQGHAFQLKIRALTRVIPSGDMPATMILGGDEEMSLTCKRGK